MMLFSKYPNPTTSTAALECSQEEIDYLERVVDIFRYFSCSYPPKEENFLPNWDRIPLNGGIALRFSHGNPASLLTSFGRLVLPYLSLQPQESDSYLQKVSKDLDLELVLEKEEDSYGGAFGPIFSIRRDEGGYHLFPIPNLEKIRVFDNFTPISSREMPVYAEQLKQLFRALEDRRERKTMDRLTQFLNF